MRPLGDDRRKSTIERRYLSFLVEVGAILGESLDYSQTLQRVCAAAVGTMADTATMFMTEKGELRVVAAAHYKPERSERLRKKAEQLLADSNGPRRVIERVIRTGTSLLVESVDDHSIDAMATGVNWSGFMRELDVRSFVVVPLVSQSRGVLGALTLVYSMETGSQYDREMLILAEDLGRRCGAAISKARLYDTALNVSTTFQMASLPRTFPIVEGVRLDAFYEPASSEMLVGGDWYDAFLLPDGRLGLSVGDISGHGVDAAAFMRSLRDALRVALYLGGDMLGALQVADLLLKEEAPEGLFATANLAIADLKAGLLTCIAAGHPGPLYWSARTNEVSDPFTERGLPLGFRDLAVSSSEPETIDLHSPSFFVYFTDGLVEGHRDYLAGEDLLKYSISRPEIREARRPAEALRNAVAPDRHPDDIAVLTVNVD